MTQQSQLNAMTVDLEEHFQVSAFAATVRREDWEGIDSRVAPNTARLLDLLDQAGVRATFFILGWVAERHRELVRRIAERGHEIGCHGYSHKLIYSQAPAEFREETVRAKRILEDASGREVRGYRAASFSISRRSLWALDVLVEAGFAYDSSVFPVVHDVYGIPGAPRVIHRLRTASGTIVEVPPSTMRIGKLTLPVAGGGYLRIYPLVVTRWAIGRLNRRERTSAIVYIHPWELDPDQPRIRSSWKSRFRHYSGLRTTERKLLDILRRFPFGPMADVIAAEGELPLWSPT